MTFMGSIPGMLMEEKETRRGEASIIRVAADPSDWLWVWISNFEFSEENGSIAAWRYSGCFRRLEAKRKDFDDVVLGLYNGEPCKAGRGKERK